MAKRETAGGVVVGGFPQCKMPRGLQGFLFTKATLSVSHAVNVFSRRESRAGERLSRCDPLLRCRSRVQSFFWGEGGEVKCPCGGRFLWASGRGDFLGCEGNGGRG